MKLQIQKHNECFPTVVAMLVDKPVGQVKRALLGSALAKESWSYLSWNGNTEKSALLVNRVSRYLEKFLPWLPLESFVVSEIRMAQGAGANDFSGRGAMIIIVRQRGRHIVAFENGMIFDPSPAIGAPVPAADYLMFLRANDRYIESIYREGDK